MFYYVHVALKCALKNKIAQEFAGKFRSTRLTIHVHVHTVRNVHTDEAKQEAARRRAEKWK